MSENNSINSNGVMEEIAKKKMEMLEGLSKDEMGNFVNSPENFKIYLDYKLDLVRLKIEKEEKERIFKAQEAEKERISRAQEEEKNRQRDEEFWSNLILGTGVLYEYLALTKQNNTNSSNQNSKKE